MKNLTLISLSALCALACGCSNFEWSGTSIKGSGNVVSETRQLTHFDRVTIFGSGHLTVVQGEQEGLTIQADDNLLPYIKSEVAGGSLKLGPEDVNLRPTKNAFPNDNRKFRCSGTSPWVRPPCLKAWHYS